MKGNIENEKEEDDLGVESIIGKSKEILFKHELNLRGKKNKKDGDSPTEKKSIREQLI